MKVLLINAVSGIRSTGRLCVQIADYLNTNGIEAFIAYSAGTPYQKGYKMGTPLEIKLHGLYSRVFGTQAYFSKRGTRKLLRYMDKLKPDVVHLGNLHSNYINLKMLLNYLAEHDIATVLTLWDCWFFTGKCCHYAAVNCSKWQSGCYDCPRLKAENPSWFFDRTKKMYRDKKMLFGKIPRLAVVGVSDWITNEAKKSFLACARDVVRIYNWINLDVFKPTETDHLRRRFGLENLFVILGVASGWAKSKGLGEFIELAGLIPDDMKIVLVGGLSPEIKLPGNIIQINETNDVDELAEYYSMADVFVNFSKIETFGLVTAEALACGTPAIVMDSTANPELVGNGCGFVADIDDVKGVLRYIDEVRNRGKESFSGKCIEYTRNNFKKDERIRDYTDVYRSLLQL